ncbi:hypothetical protein RRG08_036223 [Elysia crispata]|uniref:Uncharacterized protein n=1 Tax=Elysia crispata TaxID=231223 RepID=A0AAE0XEF1_9GAST|nr:hypothetical protein RRG08_036223 [Elysia crispata]
MSGGVNNSNMKNVLRKSFSWRIHPELATAIFAVINSDRSLGEMTRLVVAQQVCADFSSRLSWDEPFGRTY